MISSMRMEDHQSNMTERILNLTLEIIYLLTGENFPLVKSSGRMTITVPPRESLSLQKNGKQKILEAIKKMTELLTGEVPIRCQDVTVYFSMEEWEYLEGHKELYKDVMMASQPALTSPDGSSNGKPPERCPRPLYSNRDPTQEDPHLPHHHQTEDLGDYNIIVKEEYKEEDEEYGVMTELSEGHKDLMMELPRNRNLPQRRPRPLYMQRDPTQEDSHTVPRHHQVDHTIPHHDRGEDVMDIKVEGEVEETYVRDDQQYTEEEEEAGMRRTFIEEDTPTHISTGPIMLHSVDSVWIPSASQQPRERDEIREQKTFSCPECGESFTTERRLSIHLRSHVGEKLHACSECGKCFLYKSALVTHYRSHTQEKTFSCPECGKCFACKSELDFHYRSHTREQLYPYPECGKSFTDRTKISRQQRLHAEENLYSGPEGGKNFSSQSIQMPHSGRSSFFCHECGKCFAKKSNLNAHQILHTGEKPYSCPECGKCFSHKSGLNKHKRSHTGEKPFPCPQCGKCFTDKTKLSRHQKMHTGEKPYACSVCGKCHSQKSDLVVHQRSHTGERPYPCPECGKCFSKKSNLNKHQKTHMASRWFDVPSAENVFYVNHMLPYIRELTMGQSSPGYTPQHT